ncbi:Glucosyltransferase-like protein [Tulasnella sp. 330]|nr:Glucosyltransferase-like protein [Tulasnella sp. 330]
MRIVITGGSGTVAQGLIELALAKTDYYLVLVDRVPPAASSIIDNPRIEYVTAELRTYTTYLEILSSKRADALIHLAAYRTPWHAHASETFEANVVLSYNALVAAAEAGVKRVVMASRPVHGIHDVVNAIGGFYCPGLPKYEYFPIDEEHPMRPEDAYSLSKQVLEMQCDSIARTHPDMSIASLRLHHCTLEKKRGDPHANNWCKDLWGWTSTESAARACLFALSVPWKGHEAMFIASPEHCAHPLQAEDLAVRRFSFSVSHTGLLRNPTSSSQVQYYQRSLTLCYSELFMAPKPLVGRASPTTSIASFRTRAESETDYEEILSPQPRRTFSHLQGWMRNFDENEPPPLRASSPLRPKDANSHARKSSLPHVPVRPETVSRQTSLRPVAPPSSLHDARLDSPARRCVRWMVRMRLRNWVTVSSIAAAVWIRWSVGLAGYSGHATPPMYGDYEAQRHWMEITLHLPMREWYSYDLPYWGLDYPPLTAYISYVCGLVANAVNPAWVALDSSRGFEDPPSKVFMRASVLALDLMLYIPAAVWFTRSWWSWRSRRTQNLALLTILLQPALILIDNGHFQYNSVMLGFTLLSLDFIYSGHDILAAVSFVLSLCFKQMALYYSPAIFAYLLGRCITRTPYQGLIHLSRISATTVISFTILFSPFIFTSFPSLLLQSITRIFPFSRGLFEDKVANFWCASNVVIKWKHWVQPSVLPKVATLVTLAAISPPMIHLLVASWGLRERSTLIQQAHDRDNAEDSPVSSSSTSATQWKKWPSIASSDRSSLNQLDSIPSPTTKLLLFALFNCSMAFFLFSFQVHEKSILLPLMPLTLLMSGRAEVDTQSGTWEWGVLVNNTAVFSMWPLLKKDGLGLQYAALTFLWNYVIGYNPITMASGSMRYLSLAVYAGIASLHAGESIFTPPARYPDLFPVLNVLLSGTVFGLAWLWGMKKQLEEGWAIAGLGGPNRTAAERDRIRLASLPAKSRVPIAGSDMRKESSSGQVDSHARRRPS